MFIIILLFIIGFFTFSRGIFIYRRALGIYSPLDETIVGVLEGEKLVQAFATQKRKKLQKILGTVVAAIGGCVMFGALCAIAMRLPDSKLVFGWLSVGMITTGALLMYFGGDKSSGGDGIGISLPSLKQVAGVILWFSGVALLFGLFIGN